MRHYYLSGLLLVIVSCIHTPVLAQGRLWGTSPRGGEDGAGVIFRTDADGSHYTVVKDFEVVNAGARPQYVQLTLAANGKLYGSTSLGGRYNAGVLFEFDPATDAYEAKIEFEPATTGTSPQGGLLEVAGKLYGVTSSGGLYNAGVIFEFNPANGSFAKKVDLDGWSGKNPFAGLTAGLSGKLYGTTLYGGGFGDGVIFEFDPATAQYSLMWNFDRETSGAYPLASLTLASSGLLYGLATRGGVNDNGTVFSFDPVTYAFKKRVDFSSETLGATPAGSLVEAAGGKFYGMTTEGGVHDRHAFHDGTLFEYDTASDVLVKKIDFDTPINGSLPFGSLLRASNGTYYGMTSFGGPDAPANGNAGVLFAYTSEEGVVAKHQFDYKTGAMPYGSLTEVNGKLYGTTVLGGLGNVGTIFAFDLATGTYTKKVDLGVAPEGTHPTIAVTPVAGKILGVTNEGGEFGQGTIFEYDTATGAFLRRFDFSEERDGMLMPGGKLTLAGNGKLYGIATRTLETGGLVLFEFDAATGTVVKKLDFDSNSVSSVTLASDGKLYGVTRFEGVENAGQLFAYDPATDGISYVASFTNATGSGPQSPLIESRGVLYGFTEHGGVHGFGTLYSYNLTTGVLAAQYHLDWISTSTQSFYGLTEGQDGMLYSTTWAWMGDQVGAIVQFDPVRKTLDIVHQFTMLNGGLPNRGSLTLLPGGALVGQTYTGGEHRHGVLYHFDPRTKVYTIRHDFDAGTVNDRSALTFVPAPPPVITGTDNEAGRAGVVYPNPAADRMYLDAAVGTVREIRVVSAVAHRTSVPFVKAEGRYELDIAPLAPGFYVLEVYTSNDVRKMKVVKK